MSNQIQVDTGKVVAVANRISELNHDIDNEFERVEKAIQRLNGRWNSRSSGVVIGKFYSIKNNFKDNRFKVMQDYSNFLKQQVSDGYNTTETANTNLADAFK